MTDSSSTERADPSVFEEVGAALKREGRQAAEEARTAAERLARDQRDALADYVAALASAGDRGAEDLEASGYPGSAAAVSRTAGEVEDFAGRLRARAPGELWADVEDFARDHPGLVFAGGFALAFGLTRFLKSSAATPDDDVADLPPQHGDGGPGRG
ncbi:MAG: hypothetical protein ACFCUW_16250 [Kiloniellaceae bacterium]